MTNYKTINNLVDSYKAGNKETGVLLLTHFDSFLKRIAIKYSKKEPNLSVNDLYQHGVYVFFILCGKYRSNTGVDFVGYLKKYFEGTFTDLICEV
jgi:DNA-directed RNA polymerase specialized sigma subunit